MLNWIRKFFVKEEKKPEPPKQPVAFQAAGVGIISDKNYQKTREQKAFKSRVAELTAQIIVLDEELSGEKLRVEELETQNKLLKTQLFPFTKPAFTTILDEKGKSIVIDNRTQRRSITEMKTDLKVKISRESKHPDPARFSENEAGYELYAQQMTEISPQKRGCIPTGLIIEEIPEGFFAKIYLDPEIVTRKGYFVLNDIMDGTFKGEVKVLVYNCSASMQKFKCGAKIGRLVFEKSRVVEWSKE